jgi:hypothetical protein
MCLNERYSKVNIGKHLSDNFPVKNGLKHADVLSPLLFNFASDYAIRKVQENKVGLNLNVTYQLLFYADDMNILGDTIDTIKKNAETLIDASKEVGLEVNAEKTKYMLLSRQQNAGHGIKIGNRCFENVAQFRNLGMTVTNQNLIEEEIKRRLNSGNACYHSVQKLSPFRPLSEYVKIRIQNTIVLLVVLYGYETSSLTLREEHRLRVFEKSVLRRICGPKRDEVTGGRRKLYKEGLHNLYSSPNTIRMSKSSRMR